MKTTTFHTLEEDILLLQEEAKETPISIGEILRVLDEKGRPLLLLLLSLPFCQPIPLPGLSILFGIVIAIIGFRMFLGGNVWLPASIMGKKVEIKTFRSITDGALKLIRKIRPWIHPRLSWLCHSFLMDKVNGLIIALMGILLALPLPIPFSNLTAGWAVFTLALGMLEDDGYLIISGYLISILTIAFFLSIAVTLHAII